MSHFALDLADTVGVREELPWLETGRWQKATAGVLPGAPSRLVALESVFSQN